LIAGLCTKRLARERGGRRYSNSTQ